MADYNTITDEDVVQEIGCNAYKELGGLIGWLEDRRVPTDNKWLPPGTLTGHSFRYAPSIISRCEAEVFNLSIPRFAIRAYRPENESWGFMNLRRVQTFCTYAQRWSTYADRWSAHGGAINGFQLNETWRQQTPSDILRQMDQDGNLSPIADCLLVRPKWIDDHYHVIEAPLGHLLGEVPSSSADVKGVPYVKHINLMGGGLCAQAVCFIGTMLMHEYAAGVHGLADITQLAKGGMGRIVGLRGLGMPEIVRYFSHRKVRLRGDCEVFLPWDRHVTESEMFSKVTRAYLLSGMPVICPIDMGRAMGLLDPSSPQLKPPNILESNGFPPQKNDIRRRSHATILVGCGRDREHADQVLYHDTAVRPFMQATFDQLYDARCYTGRTMKHLQRSRIMPITPAQVRLPLAWCPRWIDDSSDDQVYPGLVHIASRLQSGSFVKGLPRSSRDDQYDPGEFRLCRFRWPKPTPEEAAALKATLTGMLGEEDERLYETLVKYLRPRNGGSVEFDSWVWVQYQPESRAPRADRVMSTLWLWDAEREARPQNANAPADLLEFLLGVFQRDGQGRWQPLKHPGIRGGSRDSGLTISLISSFSAIGLQAAVTAWRDSKELRYCDLYTLMQKDAIEFREHFELPPHMNSRGVFAALQKRDGADKYVAGQIHGKLAGGGPVVCRAMATFLPGLMWRDDNEAKECVEGLLFLVRVADILNLDYYQRIHALEFVAGSMVEGALPVSVAGNKTFVACMEINRPKAIRRMLDRLGPVAAEARKRGLFLALEMEPGVNFAVNSWDAMVTFCTLIENTTGKHAYDLRANVGLNLDVAHWNLAGIEPANISTQSTREGSELIRRHVVHCHLSDHGRGHFADLAPGTVHDPDYFYEWVKAIASIHTAKFGRTVAIELEACKNAQVVQASLRVVSDILGRLADPRRASIAIKGIPKPKRQETQVSVPERRPAGGIPIKATGWFTRAVRRLLRRA